MEQQSLLIGLGGTGSRVVNNVTKLLTKNGKTFNDNLGRICCAVLDSDKNDNELITKSRTQIPVFPISKPQKIQQYFDQYRNRKIAEWSPDSPAFREQSMLDGCSEVRVKSRIAFFDYLETNMNGELGALINRVLKNNVNTIIRIMIVSSLSGGTGSGMFIQTALWLRKHLAQSNVVIRGIFLLPDIFIDTVKHIRETSATRIRHYANAYAAIRELNAITKIKRNLPITLNEKIELEGLFDSESDANRGKPVFDYCFFIDSRNAKGVGASDIAEYEQMVAQLVYMQLYSPMAGNMYTEEDNSFSAFNENSEPLFGACGSAKAEYPVDSVKTFCAIRAAQDSIKNGWNRIDSEIAAKRDAIRARERDGIYRIENFDPRVEYITLFDEATSRRAEEYGRDRFFLRVGRDVKNETKQTRPDGKVDVQYSDKVDDFLKKLKKEKIEVVATKHSGLEPFERNVADFVNAEHDKTELEALIVLDENGMREAVDTFEDKVDEYAESIVNAVFPLSMGDVNPGNDCSIFGLATKLNDEGKRVFIHPVALRYILCRIIDKMRREIKATDLEAQRIDADTGGDPGATLDNRRTPHKTETTPSELLNSKTRFQRLARFLDMYEQQYAEFINTKVGFCRKYEAELLKVRVYERLMERVNALLTQLEAFFKRLPDIQEKLYDELDNNIKATSGTIGNTYYVFSSGRDKESIYKELDLTADRADEISRSVIETAYGRLCAEQRPSVPENKPYANRGIAEKFMTDSVRTFRKRIDSDPNNREIVNMDIYTAISKQWDAENAVHTDAEQIERESLRSVNFEEGEESNRFDRTLASKRAFMACTEKLFAMAAPMLISDIEPADINDGTITTRTNTFWGFNPIVSERYSEIGATLGINAGTEQNDAYPINELHCYRAVYGLEAKYIPKLNEINGGVYYESYKNIITKMVRRAAGGEGENAYVSSPHLDKRWHRILPYVTPEKNAESKERFFRGVWLALAYGKIRVNADGNFCLRQRVDNGRRMSIDEDVVIMHGGRGVDRKAIYGLIAALSADLYFKDIVVPELEVKYVADVNGKDSYEDTTVFKALINNDCGLNPVDAVLLYYNGLNRDFDIAAPMVGAIDRIAEETGSRFGLDTDAKRAEKTKYMICKAFYDVAAPDKEKDNLFREWKEKFAELGL